MANLLHRIRRLETRLTDVSGLVPHSEEWYAYWENVVDRWMAGEDPMFRGRFPIAVIDHMIEQADKADGLLQ